MKKGFTMIELIFVIVILGILASVAVPRLASTREDAEISATVANLRTLVSDASSYYVANGTFKPKGKDANWRDITNVPLRLKDSKNLVQGNTGANTEVYLSAGGENCIKIELKDRAAGAAGAAATPAHIAVTKEGTGKYICEEIHKAEPVKAYLDSKVPGVTGNYGAIALGASARIYNN